MIASDNVFDTIAFIGRCSDPRNIGLLLTHAGLGVMGLPMAVNLRRKLPKHTKMIIYDVNPASLKKFAALVNQGQEDRGFDVASSAAEAIASADTLITVLPSESAFEMVYMHSESGVLAAIQRHTRLSRKLLIECGTLAASSIEKVAEACKALHNVEFVDAPISGGPMGSEAGTLSFMVGTSPELFSEIKSSLLIHMGDPKNIFHCGEVGSGTAFKIINNYISIISVLSVSEAYNIAHRMKLNIPVLTDLLNSGSAQCWVTTKNNPVPGVHPDAPASHNYEGGFRIELAEKVLALGRDLAESVGASTVLDKAALGVFDDVARDPRYAGKDARVVYKYLVEK